MKQFGLPTHSSRHLIATVAMLVTSSFNDPSALAQEAAIRPSSSPPEAIAQNAAKEDAQSADRRALLKVKDLYEEAANNGNPSQLKPHLDPEFTGVMVTNEAVQSFTDVQAYWDKISAMLGAGGRYKTKINVDGHAVIDGELAIAHGTSEDVAITAGGKEYPFSSRWTAVCRRDAEGQWKILRVHGSIDPLNNVFISSADRMARFLIGATAAAVGAVSGFFLARYFQKQRSR